MDNIMRFDCERKNTGNAMELSDTGDWVLANDAIDLWERLQTAEQDAARYRWLRDSVHSPVAGFGWNYGLDHYVDGAIEEFPL